MKSLIVALFAWTALAVPAVAQHSHGKGPNGGPMEDVAGVHAELVAQGTSVTIHITNEQGKAINTKTYSASVLIVNGSARETVTLSPSGENALKGEARGPVAAGTQVTLQLKTDAGKSGQARFRL